jgi:hypothetical protein
MTSRLLDKTTLGVRGAGTGQIPVLPLVNTGKQPKGPTKQFFLDVPYGECTQINTDVNNVLSVELQQIVITGITPIAASAVLALEFEQGTATLSTKTEHNLNKIASNALFFYYTDNAEKTGAVSFAGDPILLWQNRGSVDLRHVGRLTLKDAATGDKLAYSHAYLWLLMNTNTWQ